MVTSCYAWGQVVTTNGFMKIWGSDEILPYIDFHGNYMAVSIFQTQGYTFKKANFIFHKLYLNFKKEINRKQRNLNILKSK